MAKKKPCAKKSCKKSCSRKSGSKKTCESKSQPQENENKVTNNTKACQFLQMIKKAFGYE